MILSFDFFFFSLISFSPPLPLGLYHAHSLINVATCRILGFHPHLALLGSLPGRHLYNSSSSHQDKNCKSKCSSE